MNDLARLETACFAEAWSEASLAQLLQNPDYLVLIDHLEAEPGARYEQLELHGAQRESVGANTPMAYLIGWQTGEDVELARLGVIPIMRGQGCAGQILKASLELWQARDAQNVWLEVRESNIVARRLYHSQGFTQVGKRPNYYADGETALVLHFKFKR